MPKHETEIIKASKSALKEEKAETSEKSSPQAHLVWVPVDSDEVFFQNLNIF
jgi:hypothetical protein